MSTSFIKYGASWNTNDLVKIEIACIRKGGSWELKSGTKCGEGLLHHYRELQSLLWPKESHTRWTDLILKEILQNMVTPIMGPGSSWKTHTVSKYALTDYFCFPDNTGIVISSTDIKGLERRVWGDIKSLHRQALDVRDYLPGTVVDYLHLISTDEIEIDGSRDIRNGIICFVDGTMVDTPTGPKPIESLVEGDEVFNAIGIGKVKQAFHHTAKSLVRVTLSDGRSFDCTPEHPFFTPRGWINASCLKSFELVFSPHEIMRLLQGSNGGRSDESEILFGAVPEFQYSDEEMCSMSNGVQTMEASKGEVLLAGLHSPMDFGTPIQETETGIEMSWLREDYQKRSCESEILLRRLPRKPRTSELQTMRESVYFNAAESFTSTEQFLQRILQKEIERTENRWKSSENHTTGIGSSCNIPGSETSSSDNDGDQDQKGLPSFLRSRFGISRFETGDRNRRGDSSDTIEAAERYFTDKYPQQTWVASVEILESGSGGQYCEGDKHHSVHNIEVSGHPSYSVSGILVHNCVPCVSSNGQFQGMGKLVGFKNDRVRCIGDEFQFMEPAILEVQSNYIHNPDYKFIPIGNPNPTKPENPLHMVAEPFGGWASVPEDHKTHVWDCKFMQGRCINLDGRDSPNYDYPESEPIHWPKLTNRRTLKIIEETYGKESEQYYSQGCGVLKLGIAGRKIITPEICRQFKALDPIIWLGNTRTKIMMLDAAYGGVGGDRCALGILEFGQSSDGQIRCHFQNPIMVPVKVDPNMIPEDQIALFCKMKGLESGIPPENFFFDGRGSLAISFGRIWSPQVNVVDFGGKPTERPVSADIFIIDPKDKHRRLKRSDEHYSKFVSELWYSLRYAIESDQVRGLNMDIILDGSPREFKMVKENKIEIEAKHEMKKRTGRSPDLMDMAVIGLEGARKRGFVIKRIGEVGGSNDGKEPFYSEDANEFEKAIKESLLTLTE